MVDYKIPKPTEPLTLPDGSISKQWYNYWRTRVEDASLEEVLALIAEIQAQLAAIGDLDPRLTGLNSVQVLGQILTGAQVQLVNDQASPGEKFFYGTDEDGTKGWHERLLSTLADVDLTGLADGDAIVWDAVAGKFVPGDSGSSLFTRITTSGDIRRTTQNDLRVAN